MENNNVNCGATTMDSFSTQKKKKKNSFWRRLKRDIKLNPGLYVLCIPAVILVAVWSYIPMVGLLMAFQEYNYSKGIFNSPWIGFENFVRFFTDPSCSEIILTTLKFSVVSLVTGFPLPIILALILNSINSKFKDVFRVTSFIPNFLSTVVVVAMMKQMLDESTGIINKIIEWCGGKSIAFMTDPDYFLGVFIVSGLWQSVGWGTIIYTSALSGVDPQLYEAAKMDGANKFQVLKYVDFPQILPTIVITLILALGGLMSVGFEKIILMQNSSNAWGNEVISSHVYKVGLVGDGADPGYATAIGLFNSVINFILFAGVNLVARKTTGHSIW